MPETLTLIAFGLIILVQMQTNSSFASICKDLKRQLQGEKNLSEAKSHTISIQAKMISDDARHMEFLSKMIDELKASRKGE